MQTEAERVRSYIKSLSLAQLMQPFNRDAMAIQLNVQNPVVLDAVECWIDIRRRRMCYTKIISGHMEDLKAEMVKFQ